MQNRSNKILNTSISEKNIIAATQNNTTTDKLKWLYLIQALMITNKKTENNIPKYTNSLTSLHPLSKEPQ